MILHSSRKFVARLFTCLAAAALASACLNAQNAPGIPGIYGGAPLSEISTYRYVQVLDNNGAGFTYPLNGILNYVAYYTPDYSDTIYAPNQGNPFLGTGNYTVTYLDKNQQAASSPLGPFKYTTNTGYTNGVEVAPPNPGAEGALGVQGTVPDSAAGAVATVTLVGPGVSVSTKTNGNGFFSFYYTVQSGNIAGFLLPGTYTLSATLIEPCPGPIGIDGPTPTVLGPGTYTATATATYSPTNTTDPEKTTTGELYYVSGASTVVNFNFTRVGRVPICPAI